MAKRIVDIKMTDDFVPVRTSYSKSDVILQMIRGELMDTPSFIVFHSPGCPSCKKFMSTLKELRKHTKKEVGIGLVDITDTNVGNDILADYCAVTGVPTVFYHNMGTFNHIGTGSNVTVENMITYMNLANNPGNVYIRS